MAERTLANAFTVCPTCGALTLTHLWEHAVGWRALPQPISPIFGWLHTCETEETPHVAVPGSRVPDTP